MKRIVTERKFRIAARGDKKQKKDYTEHVPFSRQRSAIIQTDPIILTLYNCMWRVIFFRYSNVTMQVHPPISLASLRRRSCKS